MRLKSTQEWILYDEVFQDGIIKCKDKYLRIIEVFPINFNFKSIEDKKLILENYKNLFKNINFDIQIFIFNQKENFDNYYLNLKTNSKQENEIKNEYKNFLDQFIKDNEIFYKRFFVVVYENNEDSYENVKSKLNSKVNILTNNLIKNNGCKILDNNKEIIELLKYLYK